jgi:integrase
VFRSANQRNPGFALDGFRFQAIGGSGSTISGRKAAQQIEDGVFADEVPIERGFILELKKWQALCLDTEEHWLFPSPVTGRPYHADSMRTDYLVPTGLKLGLGRIGFHTFRHTYRAWLDETGAPVGVQQKLMRHAHVSTTMDQYGNASALAKRKANRPIVQRLLQRPANQEVSIQ